MSEGQCENKQTVLASGMYQDIIKNQRIIQESLYNLRDIIRDKVTELNGHVTETPKDAVESEAPEQPGWLHEVCKAQGGHKAILEDIHNYVTQI